MPNQFITFLANHSWIILAAAIWTLPWKGVALWRAARSQSLGWFIVLLIVNTLGILEIIYIFYFSRKKISTQEFETNKKSDLKKIFLDIKRD
jgi:methionyl-tRNA synthetase